MNCFSSCDFSFLLLLTLRPQSTSALHNFRPTSRDYYYSNYADAFNWNELILEEEIEKDWYIVAFRSVRAVGSTSVDLYKADRAAHEEAVESGGLIMYCEYSNIDF